MTSLRVFIPVKFTQVNLDQVIFNYYQQSLSKETRDIIFDLSLLEWINTEEIAFLFAWIRTISNQQKRVTVWMPYSYDVYAQNLYRDADDLAKAKQFLPVDSPESIRRRTNRNIFLLAVWGMLDNIGLEPGAFKNIVENYNVKANKVSEKYSHLVVPFTVISSRRTNAYHHNPYHEVIDGSKTFRKVGPFDLTKDIINRLESFNCYTPFENKIISNIITKELFANSLIHANTSGKLDGFEECYFALSLNNHWDNANTPNFLNQFLLEKDPDTLDFYKDKVLLLKDFKRRVKLLTPDKAKNLPKYREADLSGYKEQFRNISYLEFTFLDFGDGIYQTLSGKFEEYLLKPENVAKFKNERRENQILEYAFFLESSSNQYLSRLQTPELFPRGLYFLLDMVRRYKGLLVVRSGSGKIIYDFSDKIAIRNSARETSATMIRSVLLQDAIKINNEDNPFFDGTMITIILPERKAEDVNYDPVRINDRRLTRDIRDAEQDTEHTPIARFPVDKYGYISMLFLYEQVIRGISAVELAMVKGFDSLIYILLLEELKKRSTKGALIFIDFEFYPRTENIQQLLFYLTNSPYINEHTKAVIMNLSDSPFSDKNHQQRYSVIKDFKVNIYAEENEPHIFRPIPSINIDMYDRTKLKIIDISWIGVEPEADEELLTNLLIGKEEEGYPVTYFNSKTNYSGNIFAPNQGKLHAIFNTSLELLNHFEKARHQEIAGMINGLIDDGSQPGADEDPYIFQSAAGGFQTRYLSLYESLHNKYLAKYLAKRILDRYLFYAWPDGPPKFNKILTVTVSSQLVGVAIRDLIKDDPAYEVLKTGPGNTISDCPSLIMLASYYSFEAEKPFKKIDPGDTILIVNDVISTGGLVKKLVAKVRGKRANVPAVVSIADCRPADPVDSDFANIPFFRVIGYPDQEIDITKHPDKRSALNDLQAKLPTKLRHKDVLVKRINPLLNTVVGLSDEDSEKQRILFNAPEDLLPKDENELAAYQEHYFKIGHFVQNLSHNGYLTNMRSLFSDPEGLQILTKIKTKIDKEYQFKLHTDGDDHTKLFSIVSLADQLQNKEQAEAIKQHVQSLLTVTGNVEKNVDKSYYRYQPDFIFFPVFSGIENLPQRYFHEVFGTPYENIIGLQRFETDKGWRFPFPPKRFNNITKGKQILIFDSGALTGESLVQMIDTISILDITKIDVISVIGRVEDFNREFFSRIKSLKVKALHKEGIAVSGDLKLPAAGSRISIANLNIFFAINLHIPVYPSKSNCPFCEERKELLGYNEVSWGQKFPQAVKDYIGMRLDELKITDFNFDWDSALPSYIPLLKQEDGSKSADVVSIFLMRDQLGRIDSYRFYKEYYTQFDEIIKCLDGTESNDPDIIKKLELIMICILHEPKLYKVHRDLLVNIHDHCKSKICAIVEKRNDAPVLNFDWSTYAMVRLFLIYHNKTELTLPVFETLFDYAKESPPALNYLSFILWKGFKNIFNDPYIKEQSSTILSRMSDSFDAKNSAKTVYQNNEVRNIIKSIVNTFENTEVGNVNDAFFNLRKFFFSQSSDNSHSELKRIILRLISAIENQDLSKDELNDLFDVSTNIRKMLETRLLDNLTAIRNDVNLKDCDELQYHSIFQDKSVYSSLKALIELQTDLIAQRRVAVEALDVTLLRNFAKELDKFQIEYLLEGSAFVNYCRRYKCDLKKCVDSALNSGRVAREIKQRKNFVVISLKEHDVFVNGHSDLLTHAFEEIFFNAAHCKSNNDMTITMSLKKHPETGVVELHIFQNKPFVKNTRINGIDKIILPIFRAFCGQDGIELDTERKKSYIITIKFNQYDLKND